MKKRLKKAFGKWTGAEYVKQAANIYISLRCFSSRRDLQRGDQMATRNADSAAPPKPKRKPSPPPTFISRRGGGSEWGCRRAVWVR